jgi:hypothetical protein
LIIKEILPRQAIFLTGEGRGGGDSSGPCGSSE